MAKDSFNYRNLGDSPYDGLLSRTNDLNYQFGGRMPPGISNMGPGQVVGSGSDDGTTQTPGGSVSTVTLKSEGNATDVWIQNFIRSVNWKPKTVGFYINGATGYAEFANVYVSGTIVVNSGTIGGFIIGADFIRDALNTMGMAATVTGGDDVRFWAGDTFANRVSAPFRVTESGTLYATNAIITGGVIDGAIIANANGLTDPTFTPDAIGQVYINTALGRPFIAIGTNSDSDWLLLAATALPRSASIFEVITIAESITMRNKSVLSVFDTVTITENISLAVI